MSTQQVIRVFLSLIVIPVIIIAVIIGNVRYPHRTMPIMEQHQQVDAGIVARAQQGRAAAPVHISLADFPFRIAG